MIESVLSHVHAHLWHALAYTLAVGSTVLGVSLKDSACETRINVSTLALAVLIAVLVAPAYKDLSEQIQGSGPSWFTWLPVAFLYTVQGGSALMGARFLSNWVFAHERDGKRAPFDRDRH